MVDKMLRFFAFLIFSVSCYSAYNYSSLLDGLGLWLPHIADLAKTSTSMVGSESRSPGQIFARGISQDLSCPKGFLCVQQACPANILCPAGETCVNFEGTFACAVPGPKICALNPNTFQAVGCNGGTCCHGNCYTADAVCCDFPSIECTIGGLCNACTPGQTCGNNQCAGGAPSTTSKASTTAVISLPPNSQPPSKSSTIPTISTRSASSTSSTTSASSAISISSTNSKPTTTTTATTSKSTTSTISTTSTAPTPTLVTSSGEYIYSGCFEGGAGHRVLVAGSSSDFSSTGNTVEKCIALARKGAFQYAGVEYGGQCFVGNTLHGASPTPDDCNQVCAGNPLQICGAANRISIYTDPTWLNPTTADLVTYFQQYTDILSGAQKALSDYHTHLVGLKGALANGLRKRSQTQTVVAYQMDLLEDAGRLETARREFVPFSGKGRTLVERGASIDIPVKLVPEERYNEAENLLADTYSAVSDAASIASDDRASLSESIAGSTAPFIDIQGRIATVTGGINSIGLPAIGAAAATGLFIVLGGLLSFFLGGGNNGGNPDPPCTTITVQACAVGCSVTNFGDTSTVTTCYTTSCSNKVGCGVRATTTTTATTTALCALTTEAMNSWIPDPDAFMPYLGSNNAWTTPV